MHTEPGVSYFNDDELDTLAARYEANVGNGITPGIGKVILAAREQGVSFEMILNAIDETGMARRPSAHYLRAILERYIAEGIYTTQDYQRDQRRRKERAASRSTERYEKWGY